jgi:hypothetical protein
VSGKAEEADPVVVHAHPNGEPEGRVQVLGSVVERCKNRVFGI